MSPLRGWAGSNYVWRKARREPRPPGRALACELLEELQLGLAADHERDALADRLRFDGEDSLVAVEGDAIRIRLRTRLSILRCKGKAWQLGRTPGRAGGCWAVMCRGR